MNRNPNIPETHQAVIPYLILKNANEFSKFMQHVFDAKETCRYMSEENTIMHAEVVIDNCTIMFTEANDQYAPSPAGIFIYVDDVDDTFNKAIKQGASIITEIKDQEYGRSGGVRDPFGNQWWITSPIK